MKIIPTPILAEKERSSKNLRLAGLFWMLNVQFFVVQILVARSFSPRFSISKNTISDLGNTVCGPYGERLVCSPDYLAMNISLIVLGATIIIGSLLILKSFPKNRFLNIGLTLMILSGIGTILAALYPENSVSLLHILGAALSFVFGNIAVILLANTPELRLSRLAKRASILFASVALVLLILMITSIYLWIGLGGIERIVAYVQTFWMILVGTKLVIIDTRANAKS